MGGMIAQSYAQAYPNPDDVSRDASGGNPRLLSLTLACTYASPSPFCMRLFDLWAAVAPVMGVQAVMRDVVLRAFTVPFFLTREDELKVIEADMERLDMSVESYLAQLNVIREFSSNEWYSMWRKAGEMIGGLEARRVCVLIAEEDVLIPVLDSEMLAVLANCEPRYVRGGHGCVWEFPEEFNRVYLDFLKGVGEFGDQE